ncbi:hypothetical protein GGI04_000802 [Coemansia thaxteri]|nr:hypothetical protein GGI04_000802 [Coemansia thaxteri]KAJ2473246.1 hypothetical protein GGI02_001011 [Coemansia sp. RSA 2322]
MYHVYHVLTALLPKLGIGAFVVVDDGVVSEQDMATNFFVGPDDGGKLRAQCIVQGLCELNPDVSGSAVTRSPAELLASIDPADVQLVPSATLVIACAQPDSVVCDLSRRCWLARVPFIAADSAGFFARLRTSIPEHAVVESHVEMPFDLRLVAPFPALRSFIDEIDLDALDSTDLGHVPFLVILTKALEKWSLDTGTVVGPGGLPLAKRKLLQRQIMSMAPTPDEENFTEASNNAQQYCVPYKFPPAIAQILDDQAAVAPVDDHTKADKFWLLVRALKAYVQSDHAKGALPLDGTIPDMKADTKRYIALQRVYKQKAAQDIAEFAGHVSQVLAAASLPPDYISSDEVAAFCRNASRLRLLRFTPLHDELEGAPCSPGNLVAAEAVGHYVLFRASNRFETKHGRYPGVQPETGLAELPDADFVKKDAEELTGIANTMLSEWGMADAKVDDELAMEFARSGHCELHNIAAIAGGIIAQEAIKLATRQYVPENSLCIVDGVKARNFVAKI